MRNLKKILALVLALVMSLSLVTIANAADFKDSDEIDYEEAVAVMSAIGVIEGFEDGTFDPNGTLTREQAAKLVTYMLLGNNAEKLGVESSSFKDVAVTRWSAPAIEYCKSLGIIDGAGDGNFYPAGQLTGYAFAKVLLTAIGYDSKIEGFTGASWSINVAAKAGEVGLDKGLENGITSAVITRQEAAQMALNAIKAPLVTYDKQASITVNGAEVNIGAAEAKYVTTTLAKEQRISDRQLTNSNDYTVEFGEKYFPLLRLNTETDAFERPSHTWVYKSEEIGTYVDYETLVKTYTEGITGKTLYELLGSSTINKYGLAYYVDGVVNTGITDKNMIRSNTVKYGTTGNGVLTQVFVDHNKEEITITSINTYLAKANSDYNSTNETLSLKVFQNDKTGTTKIVDVADVPAIADITKDDYVLVNLSGKDRATGAYDVVKLSEVEIMTDSTITKFTKSNGTKIASKMTVGGEEIEASHKAFYDKDVLDEYDQALLTDMSYNVYRDQYGYAIGVDLYEGAKNYVFITGYDRGTSHISIKTATAGAIFVDGSMKEITVNVTDTNKNIDRMNDNTADGGNSGDYYFTQWTGAGKVSENRWYTYTVNENNVYTLKPVANMFATNLADGTVIKSAYVYMDDSLSNKGRAYGNDNSAYITVEAGTVDLSTPVGAKDAITEVNGLYTGVQNVDIEVTNAAKQQVPNNAYTLYDNDRYIIATIVLGEAQGSVNNYAYILGSAKNEELKSDGYYYWQFDAVVGGEKVTLTAKTKYSSTIEGLKPYHVQELRYDGEYVTAVKDVENSKFYTNTSLPINKQDIYDVGHVHTGGGLDTTYGTGCTLPGSRINGTVVFDGRTLYTNYGYGDVGLAVASDAKAVLIQNEGTVANYERKVYSCGSVSEAIGRLADADTLTPGTQFKGRVVAALNGAGVAQWVVFISDTQLVIGGGGSNPSTGLLNEFTMVSANNYQVRYYGAKSMAEIQSYVIDVVERNTGMSVRSYNPATRMLIFEDYPFMPVTVTPIQVYAFKVDGAIKKYQDPSVAWGSVSGVAANGWYILTSNVVGTGIQASASGVLTWSSTATGDVELSTAYPVTLTGVTATCKRAGVDVTVNSGDKVASGASLTLTGAVGDNTYRQFTVNGNNFGAPAFVATGSYNTATYPVTGAVTIAESKGYLVQIDGASRGVYAAGGKVTFTAPVAGANYVAAHTLTDGKGTTALTGGLTSTSTTFEYTVNASDASSTGVINLVQVAKVDALNGGVTATVPNSTTPASPHNVAANDYIKVGTVMSLTGAATNGKHIQVNGTNLGTPGNGSSNATATYQIKSADTNLTFGMEA